MRGGLCNPPVIAPMIAQQLENEHDGAAGTTWLAAPAPPHASHVQRVTCPAVVPTIVDAATAVH